MRTGRPRIELAAGERFGRLVVAEATRISGRLVWLTRCDCGNTHAVPSHRLRSGDTRSCGCLHSEQVSERNRKHGLSGTPEFGVWRGMLTRCYNGARDNYRHYGGRGVSVCDRWSGACGFANFIADMGQRPSERHSIDRIDPTGDYEPGNCRWVTITVQARNRRNLRLNEQAAKVIRSVVPRRGHGAIALLARLHHASESAIAAVAHGKWWRVTAAAIALCLVAVGANASCVTTLPALWPPMAPPTLRPNAIANLIAAGVYPLDAGALRVAPDGCVEVLESGTWTWRRYVPALDLGSANKFSMVGPGWSAGHTSSDAFDFFSQYEDVYGHPMPGGYEGQLFVQYEYSAQMRRGIQQQWCQLPANVALAACGGAGPLPTATPAPSVPPPAPAPTPTPVATPQPTPSPTPRLPSCQPARAVTVPAGCDALRVLAGKAAPSLLTWGAQRLANVVECWSWIVASGGVGGVVYVPGVLSTGATTVELCGGTP